MSKSVSIYFPDNVLEWVDEQAREERRKRSNQVIKILEDVKEGRLVPAAGSSEEPELRKARLPPTART